MSSEGFPAVVPDREPERPVRVRLDIAYVGTLFHGWQIQPGYRTVQGVLRHEVSRLLGYQATPVGAGRTDSGVHARGQVAHLSVRTIEEFERLDRALALAVPEDIQINAVRRVSQDFNARFSATARSYSYRIQRTRDIFNPHCWQIYWDLDPAAMDTAAAVLLGDHDFASFCKTSSLKASGNACLIEHCRFQWHETGAIFQIRANRFLHHMVRIMVGTLMEIGRGERAPGEMTAVLAARDRRAAGRMAPARGLFMDRVEYPEYLLDPEEKRKPMKFFIDTANLEAIKGIKDMGMCDGVTTNPSLMAKEGRTDTDAVLKEICEVVQGPVSGEVTALDAEGMIAEGKRLAALDPHMVVKIPTTYEGLKAIAALARKGIPVNATLVFSLNQALLVAKAGAAYVSPFVGRLDDIGEDGMQLISDIVEMYDTYDYDTEVIVASVRHPMHVVDSALLGAHIATIPPEVIKKLVAHPLTDKGLAGFMADWDKLQGGK